MRYQLFGVGLHGKSAKATSQRRQNCYYEFQENGDHTRVVIFGTPGLVTFVDFGDTPVRGMHEFKGNSRLYIVHRATLWEVDNSGTKTSRGTLNSTSGIVSMADNGTEIMIVDGTDGYIFNTSTLAFAEIIDAQFPANPQTVCFHNTRFIVNKASTGEFYQSDSYAGTAWTALMFATAESAPDNLVRVAARDELILFGEATTEFWADTGSGGFPYARIPGTNSQWGLGARWSLAKYLDSFVYLARNSMGEVMVAYLAGHQVDRLSDFELESIINNYAVVSDATGFAYMLGGHPMYQLNFPTAGTSWLYDGATRLWSQLKSADITRHRADLHANFINTDYVSDYSNGKIYRLDPDVYADNGNEIELELVSRHVVNNDKMFRLNTLEIIFEAGVGLDTGQGSDPQAMLSISKDGGKSYGNEIFTSIGKVGEYTQRARWRRLGQSRDWVFKLRITDPVKRVIVAENIQ